MSIPGFDWLNSILAIPLGYILWLVYRLVSNYFVAIFLFTLLIRTLTFPLSIKSQKSQADRARLAPRLERLQKKYAKDPKKLQEKQMALYEKEGVSMTGGCLPLVVQMIILFGIIAVIYSPITYIARFPSEVVSTSISAVAQKTENGKDIADPTKLSSNDRKGVYKELKLLMVVNENHDEIIKGLSTLSADQLKGITPEGYYQKMVSFRKDFSFFGKTMLENPWNEKGFAGINVLWIIVLFSGLTAFASSFISMKFMNMAMAGQQQPGQGCSNNMMIIAMPLFSLFITFTVPGGVGVYWICSNIIAIGQTIILNKMYNPAKIRAQAEIEYQQLRERKLEDKKRLAEARARDEAEARQLAAEESKSADEKRKAAGMPKAVPSSKNPNKIKRRDNGETALEDSEPMADSQDEDIDFEPDDDLTQNADK